MSGNRHPLFFQKHRQFFATWSSYVLEAGVRTGHSCSNELPWQWPWLWHVCLSLCICLYDWIYMYIHIYLCIYMYTYSDKPCDKPCHHGSCARHCHDELSQLFFQWCLNPGIESSACVWLEATASVDSIDCHLQAALTSPVTSPVTTEVVLVTVMTSCHSFFFRDVRTLVLNQVPVYDLKQLLR